MMKKITQQGFTLIELLVVIAIIGILAGVVLTSLGSARSSAADSKVKSQLASIRAEAEIYSGGNAANGYTNMCGNAQILALRTINGTAHPCFSNATTWIVTAPITGGHWCADHTGASTNRSAAATAAGQTCN